MRKEIFGAFAALLAASGTAEAQTPAPPATCALPSVVASSDLKDVAGSNLLTVPVEINGKPQQFLLAVGTNPTEISAAAVGALGLTGPQATEVFQSAAATQSDASMFRNFDTGATMQVTMVDARNAITQDNRTRVNVGTFTIGGATGHNLRFVVAADNEIPKSAPYDGIMSGNFFKQYDVEMDFAGKKLVYLTPNSCPDPNQIVFWSHKAVAQIPINLSDGKIELQVTIDGHQINAVVDTSSPNSVMRRDVAEDTLGLKTGKDMTPDGDRKDGEGQQIYTHTFPQISLAGVTVLNIPAAIQTNSMVHNLHREAVLGSRAQFKSVARIPALTLGMDVLRQLHMYVLYGQQNLYVTAAN